MSRSIALCALALAMACLACRSCLAAQAEEMLLAIELNGQLVSSGAAVARVGAGYVFRGDDLLAWRIQPPPQPAVVIAARAYYALPATEVVSARLDSVTQTLQLMLRPQAFAGQTLTQRAASVPITPPGMGLLLNYDVSFQGSGADSQQGGVFELAAFGAGGGVGSNRVVVQHQAGASSAVRLDSTWTRDFPDRMTTLRLGDVTSVAGAWGGSARLGGVQYGSNFATRPGFITTPLAAVSGQAALPSTVDVYVDRVLALQRQVAPGPFSVTDLPLISGSGTIMTVVTDPLGRQQVSAASFYSSPELLRRGLADFSVEAGALRSNFGTRSADYGPPAAVGTYRIGVDDDFTAEGHGEWQAGRTALGLSGAWAIPWQGVLSASLAGSHGSGRQAGSGGLFELGLQRVGSELSFTLDAQASTPGFTRFGADPGTLAQQSRFVASVSRNLAALGGLGAAYIAQRDFGQIPTRLAQFSYGVALGGWGFLDATLLRTLSSSSGPASQLGLTLNLPLGARTSASLSMQSPAAADGGWQAAVQQGLPAGNGWGYQAQLGGGGDGQWQGQYQGSSGLYSAAMQRSSGRDAWRLGAQGAAGVLDRHGFLSRSIDNSFALVETGGLPGVEIDANHQKVGTTDRSGALIVPELQAFETNVVSVGQADLPLDVDVGALSADVVPPYRAGVVVRMPIRVTRAATLILRQDNGSFLPAGALARIDGTSRDFPVGVDGAAYLSGLADRNHVAVEWGGGRCAFDLDVALSRDPLPDVGVRTCTRAP